MFIQVHRYAGLVVIVYTLHLDYKYLRSVYKTIVCCHMFSDLFSLFANVDNRY